MDRLLIVGVDTLAGSNAAIALADRCDVTGISRGRESVIPGCHKLVVSPNYGDELAAIASESQPDWIWYCGPTSYSSWDLNDQIDTVEEVKRVSAVSAVAQRCGSRVALVSTDGVFDGPRMFHREAYAKTNHAPAASAARAAEKALAGTEAMIVRTHLFGWTASGDSCAEKLWNALSDGASLSPSGSRYATPILASDMAELLWQACQSKLRGVYHLGGAERASMWQFTSALAAAARKTMKVMRLAATTGGGDLAVEGQTRCGQETSLDSRKLQRALGLPLPLLREGIARFVEQANSGYRDRLAGSVPPSTFVTPSAA